MIKKRGVIERSHFEKLGCPPGGNSRNVVKWGGVWKVVWVECGAPRMPQKAAFCSRVSGSD